MIKLFKRQPKVKVAVTSRDSRCAVSRARTSKKQVVQQEQRILSALAKGYVTPSAVAAYTKISVATVRVRLKNMVNKNLIWMDYAGPMTSYYPTATHKRR